VSIETRPDRESWWSPCRDVSDPTTDTWAPLVGCGTRAVQLIQARIHLWPPHLANLLWLKKKKKKKKKHTHMSDPHAAFAYPLQSLALS
jgi:hypothetical protein